jgi:hypothetical protein
MSIPWSPPEVFDESAASGTAADIYSLGATIYTLLAGRSPFETQGSANSGIDLISRIQSTPVLPTGRPDVPESLELALRSAMAKRPADRYSSALEFARALQKVQLELSLTVTPADVLDETVPLEADEEEDDGNTRIRGIVTIDPTGPAPARTTDRTAARDGLAAHTAQTVTRPPGGARGSTGPANAVSGPGAAAAPTTHTPSGAVVPPLGQRNAFGAAGGSYAEPVAEETVHRVAAVAPAPAETEPVRRRALPIILGAAALVVVLIIVGIVFAVNAGGGSPAAQATGEPDAPVAIVPAETVEAPAGLVAQPGAGGVVFSWTNPAPQPGDVFLWGTVTPGAEPTLAAIATPSVTVPAPAGGQVCIEVSVRRTDGHASDPVTKCAP